MTQTIDIFQRTQWYNIFSNPQQRVAEWTKNSSFGLKKIKDASVGTIISSLNPEKNLKRLFWHPCSTWGLLLKHNHSFHDNFSLSITTQFYSQRHAVVEYQIDCHTRSTVEGKNSVCFFLLFSELSKLSSFLLLHCIRTFFLSASFLHDHSPRPTHKYLHYY